MLRRNREVAALPVGKEKEVVKRGRSRSSRPSTGVAKKDVEYGPLSEVREPESREREVLAALDRASGGLEGYVVHNRATGDRTTGGDQAETRTILGHLVALGYVEQRGGFDSTRGGRTSKYSITGPGREALRA